MIKIELENADNGIIKTVTDDNYNSNNETNKIIKLYEFVDDMKCLDEIDNTNKHLYIDKLIDLYKDLTIDLGLNLGFYGTSISLQFTKDWHNKFTPSDYDIDEKIKNYKREITNLQLLKKQIKEESI